MSVSPEILKAQLEYASRPYAVRLQESHCSSTQRFNTLPEAIAYLEAQYNRCKARGKKQKYCGFDAYRSALLLPHGIEVKCEEFLGASLSSY